MRSGTVESVSEGFLTYSLKTQDKERERRKKDKRHITS